MVARLHEHMAENAANDAADETAQKSVAGVSGGLVEGGDRNDRGRGRKEFAECATFR